MRLANINPFIFTHGNKIEEKFGIDIYIKRHNKRNQYIATKFKLKTTVPIASVEITAIEKALEIAITHKIKTQCYIQAVPEIHG